MRTELFNIFNDNQLTAIKDAILFGMWGDCDQEYHSNNGWETHYSYGFCTNDIYKGGHFPNRRSLGGIISSIKKKIKKENLNFIITCHDWWEDGNGDMLFLAMDVLECSIEELNNWAKMSQ